jgi:Ca2+-dependent lipid-binding protein
MHVELWDWDKLNSNDFLGYAAVELGKLALRGKKESEPVVLKLERIKSGTVHINLLFHNLV